MNSVEYFIQAPESDVVVFLVGWFMGVVVAGVLALVVKG